MLDRAESAYFESILDDQSDLHQSFSGFTYYKNTIAFNGHTLMSTPSLYGGYEYTPTEINRRTDEKLKSKHNESLLVLPSVFTDQANFHALISDLSWSNYSYTGDMSFADGYENIESISLNGMFTEKYMNEFVGEKIEDNLSMTINRNLFWVSLFRVSVAIFRPVVYYRGTWWAREAISDYKTFFDAFATLAYLPQITFFTSEESCFAMIANPSTHNNVDLQALDMISSDVLQYPNSPAYDVNTVVLKTLGRWFNFLRENDVYDNTRIIIVSDHGMGYGDTYKNGYDNANIGIHTKDEFHALLLVKDFNANNRLVTDMTFMTTADVPTLALSGVIEKPTNPFTGNAIDSSAKQNGVFITIDDIFMPNHSKSENVFTIADDTWYHVRDNIFIDENWTQKVPE